MLIAELHYVESEVERWLSGDYAHDPERFEKVLGKLHHGQARSLIVAAVLTKSQLASPTRLARLWLFRVNALRYDVLAPYHTLEQHLDAARSPAYRQWREQLDAQLAWLSSATRQHVEAIRPILVTCGLAPGA